MTDVRLEVEDRLDHSPPERPCDPEALFEEARRRRRRRWIVCGAALCLLGGASAAGLAVSGSGGGRPALKSPHHTAPATPPPAPPTPIQQQPGVVLPSSALFNQISVTSNGLLLTGVTKAAGENPQGPCAAASITSASLAVGTLNVGNCGDPLLFGQTVEAVTHQTPPTNSVTVSVNAVNPRTGQLTDGPVVMTYEYSSDTHLVTAYSPESLWIYDAATTNGPELLQVSTHSGAVVDVVRMPKLYRPLLAADDGGVWVANSIEGSPGPALSYVTSGASAPTTVVADTGLAICWLTAGGTNAWVGAGAGWNCGNQMVQKYVDGARGPVYSTPGAGFTPFWVVGNAADGLWAMQWTQPASPGASSSQQVIFINPDTGAESVAATVPPVVYPNGVPTNGLVQGQGAYFDGALYLLEPPFRQDGYLGYTSIVRVPVSPPTELRQQ
jgi:hypothetical protein